MGFLGFLKKDKEKRMLKPFSELEFPQMPSELMDEDELEIPEPPKNISKFRSEKEIKPVPKSLPIELPDELKKVEEEFGIKPKRAVFVRADNFKTMLSEIKISKNKLIIAEKGIVDLADIKISKDKEFEKYRETLEEIQRKLVFVDKTLFGSSAN